MQGFFLSFPNVILVVLCSFEEGGGWWVGLPFMEWLTSFLQGKWDACPSLVPGRTGLWGLIAHQGYLP